LVAVGRHRSAPGTQINVRGHYIAPGFVDLHVWGDPQRVATEEIKGGTTGFLTTIGPEPPEMLVNRLTQLEALQQPTHGARCLGVHLEGPFLNPLRAGALASRWLRPPTSRELRQLMRQANGRWKLVTVAPEIPRGLEAIRWCARRGILVSVGHTDADAQIAQQAIAAGARAVTHIFNGMRSLHHRDPGLLGEALTDPRLTAMVILDGIHVDPLAFQLLWRCKGTAGVVLVTDSIRHQGSKARAFGGAFYLPAKRRAERAGTKRGILAGSRLTMIRAVRNAVVFGKLPVSDAIQMASFNPARLIGQAHQLGSLVPGKLADLVVFDQQFRVSMTVVGGEVVYQRRR